MLRLRTFIIVLAAAIPASVVAADDRIGQLPGLELWLDAQQAASEHEASAGSFECWRDRRGAAPAACQPTEAHRPRLVRLAENGWVVRFDGVDDHLRVLDFDRNSDDATLLVVAAPRANAGNYRAFIAANQRGRRDYRTGFTLDMTGNASSAFDSVNFEGRGFGGAQNLRRQPTPFGTLEIVEAVVDSRAAEARLFIDGEFHGRRPLDPETLVADELTIGARYYFNGNGPQRVQGFLDGDIAEVLLFSRVLGDDELRMVREYLETKHGAMRRALLLEQQAASELIEPLVVVENPPPVKMLVPGFSVHELPLSLTNVNNLRYRPDGRLYTLGYNGDIALLADTDGDGLEDHASTFFRNRGRLRGPIGMAVIPAGHILLQDPGGQAQGIVVASKGKVSAIIDRDGDDQADEERVIASGWKEIPQNVDATGVAFHPDGSIYFGLGTAAYNNAYLLDGGGRSSFDLDSVRGTIQRIAPDLSERTTVCTGVRFVIGMQFDERGELFVTDQEGATWLPNGNPFDELLHIRSGVHYGFPPRHPRHLPHVFDEPSLFDYGPQHQSTCGMVLNVPLETGGPIFGPEQWRGDAIVTGESRGKLYRTRLLQDANGRHVAENQLIGCLSMLTVDCCLSPEGDMLVACHSGDPDWGTGPEGIGRLFRIRYEDREAPQPVSVWAAGLQEVQVAFDRPLDPTELRRLAENTSIVYGEFVAAADRYESIRPGYAVTQYQQTRPRYRLPVYSAGISSDRQRILFSTGPQTSAVTYAMALPGEIDLAYTLSGVMAEWTPAGPDGQSWKGWLPHLDLELALTSLGPQRGRAFQELLEQPGRLELKTQLDPRGQFAPAVQPGSELDYDLGEDRWITNRSFVFVTPSPLRIFVGEGQREIPIEVSEQLHHAAVGVEVGSAPIPFTVHLSTGTSDTWLRPSWRVTTADGGQHTGALAGTRFLVPWARTQVEPAAHARDVPELAQASWGRGRQVFWSERAGCAKCHVAHGSGGAIGPDLSNLVHRDYDSVLRDVTHPSSSINPDYVTYIGELSDGRVLTGTIRTEGDRLLFGDREGRTTAVALADVVRVQPAGLSIMPDGVPESLGPERTRDLLAFLLQPPPSMPLDSPLPPPPRRTREEIAAVLRDSDVPADPAPMNILLVAGAKDHGPGEHDYPAWLAAWSELLLGAPGVTVETAMEWPAAEQIDRADTIVFFQKGSWNDERAEAMDAHLARGRGLLYIHWAVEGGPRAPEFARRIGLASDASRLRYRHGPLELGFRTGHRHPIGRNLDQVRFYDESYWLMQGDRSRIRVIGTGEEDGEPRPLFWTLEPHGGRVFVSIPGHYSWTFDDPIFRILLLRGIAWSAGEPVDRFNPLVTLGARIEHAQ